MRTLHLTTAIVLPLLIHSPRILVADSLGPAAGSLVRIVADPAEVVLDGADSSLTLLVDGIRSDGTRFDVSDQATFQSGSTDVVAVSPTGSLQPQGDGQATVDVAVGKLRVHVPVKVVRASHRRALNFENDVVPILSRFGCNASGCHGKAEGQNGFKLSVFGFDPTADYEAITAAGRGRRVFPAEPSRSLLLRKAIGQSPHGGGVRLDEDRPEYHTLQQWVAIGMPRGSADDPTVVSLRVSPGLRQMAMGARQRLRVVATWSDGYSTDVTRLATFQSNSEALASVDGDGLVVSGKSPGLFAVMAGYMGHVDVFRGVIPRVSRQPVDLSAAARANFVDEHVYRQLERLNIAPSQPADDATFMRRVYLDLSGALPTVDEARQWHADERPNRRLLLVEELMKRPEFADYQALQWADLLRVNRRVLGHKQAYLYYRWIRDNLAANTPMDRFARELLTAKGPLAESPAGHFYKTVAKPNEQASTFSQVFLGIRIECAQCHHHPFDRWSQQDYYGMQAFFSQVGFKKSPRGEVLTAAANRKTTHPRTNAEVLPHALGTRMPDEPLEGDYRAALADWATADSNPWFAKNIANRLWKQLMGRGIVEPVDDFRVTNPPTNPELLDALAAYLVDHQYDYRELIRLIVSSNTYQRSAEPNETNADDEQNFSRYPFKQLSAEVLLDAVCDTTGIGEKFAGVPAGSRAVQLWDSDVKHYFLKLFGRPQRETACECERVSEPTVSQVLHVMNSPRLQEKLSRQDGRIARLVARHEDDGRLAEALYLQFFSRFPTDREREVCLVHLAERDDRQKAAEDIAWSMMNSLEFLFNH